MRSTVVSLLLSSVLFMGCNAAIAQQSNKPVMPVPQHLEDLSAPGQGSKSGTPTSSPELQSLIKALSGRSEGKGDQCKTFTQLAEYDQRSWLDAMGDPHPLAESAEQRRFLTIPVEGSERTACSFEMKSHSDLSPGETPLAKHMGMPPARDWQDRFAAFHDVTLHVIAAWWYDARRDLTVIVYGASSAFPSSNGASKDNGPALDASLPRMMAQVRLAEAARGKP